MTSLHRQLDDMDQRLDNVEDEVTTGSWSDDNGNVSSKSRAQILQEHRDMVGIDFWTGVKRSDPGENRGCRELYI